MTFKCWNKHEFSVQTPLDYDVLSFLYIVGLCLLVFCCGNLHVCLWWILVCSFSWIALPQFLYKDNAGIIIWVEGFFCLLLKRLSSMSLPSIVHWDFCLYLVWENTRPRKYYKLPVTASKSMPACYLCGIQRRLTKADLWRFFWSKYVLLVVINNCN